MSVEELQNSPLHGLSAEAMLTELVEFYGWYILDTAVDLKCFRIKPTIPSALVFLNKAEWARNKVEDFYLYCFKGMPKPSEAELELKPRERGFPNGVAPREPKLLSVRQAEDVRMETAEREDPAPGKKSAARRVAPRPMPEPEEEEPQVSTFRSRFSRPQE